MKKLLKTTSVALILTLILSSVVSAYSVTINHFKINGSSSASVEVSKGNDVTFDGEAYYDTHVYGVPIPSTGYIELAIPYLPFSAPGNSGGSFSLPFSLGTSGVTGQTSWRASTSFTVWTTSTRQLTGTAEAEIRAERQASFGTGSGHATDNNNVKNVIVQ